MEELVGPNLLGTEGIGSDPRRGRGRGRREMGSIVEAVSAMELGLIGELEGTTVIGDGSSSLG